MDWLIFLFLPSFVSSGSIDTQLDCIEQSPQPSHTSGFIIILCRGSCIWPLFLLLLFSAAHVWSNIKTLTPLCLLRFTCSLIMWSRWTLFTYFDDKYLYFFGSCERTEIFFTPSAKTCLIIPSTFQLSPISWPPVIATASL